MSIETINLVKNAEDNAQKIINEAEKRAIVLVEKAKVEAQGIIASKVKAAFKNSDLRINASKQITQKYKENLLKEAYKEIESLQESCKEKSKEAINLVVETISSK